MTPRDPDISPTQAQALMSQLMDGELAAADAARLEAYLERHPEAADWMEGLDMAREALKDELPFIDRSTAVASIAAAIAAEDDASPAVRAVQRRPNAPSASSLFGKLLSFPTVFRPLAAAAAIALIGGITWFALSPSGSGETGAPATVEFVATDIPDASTFVYSDDESGWTVVWVETIEPEPAKHG